MTPLLQTGLTWLLQTTGLLGLGLLALWLTQGRGPTVQTLIGRATLVGVALALLLAAPLAGRIQPLWRVSLPAEDSLQLSHSGEAKSETKPPLFVPPSSTLPPAAPLPPPASPVSPAIVPSAPPVPVSPLARLYTALAIIWGTGTLTLLLWLGVCLRHLIHLCRAARPLTSGPAADALAELTKHSPRLLTHSGVRSPFLAGILRPTIFLPEGAEADFSPDDLHAILAHELAHLTRRDCAWTLFCRLLCAVLWPQPLLWLLCRRLEAIGEEACDLSVLAQNCPPRVYADCLLSLAERPPLSRRERVLGAGVAPFRSSLGRRIQRILSKGTHVMSIVSIHLRLGIAASAGAAVFGGVLLVSSAPAQTSTLSSPYEEPQPSPIPNEQLSEARMHESELDQVVNELKAAGAEAISINGQRLVATSSIQSTNDGLLINNTLQASSYTVKATFSVYQDRSTTSPRISETHSIILHQKIAALQSSIASQETTQGKTEQDPNIVLARSHLRILKNEERLQAKRDFETQVHTYERTWVTICNKIAKALPQHRNVETQISISGQTMTLQMAIARQTPRWKGGRK